MKTEIEVKFLDVDVAKVSFADAVPVEFGQKVS